MESENQIESKEEMALVVDLNRATAEELQAISGIGPTLAERIITYRETVHPFEEPVEITAVPGISEKTYRAIADHLTAAPAEPLSVSEEPSEEESALEIEVEPPKTTEVMALLPAELSPEEEAASGAEEEPSEAVSPPEELAQEKRVPELETEAPEIPPPQVAPVPAPSAPRRGGLGWLWSALLGGFLGMLFTLLVLSGINGSLDVSHSPAVLQVKDQINGLASEMDSLRGEIGGLRQRLDELGGLTARMEQAESAVDDLRGEMATLEEQASALEDEMATISEDLAAIEGQTQQMGTFFQRLQALLSELFGEVEGTGTATPTPTPSQ